MYIIVYRLNAVKLTGAEICRFERRKIEGLDS